jgi:hypothetical protein
MEANKCISTSSARIAISWRRGCLEHWSVLCTVPKANAVAEKRCFYIRPENTLFSELTRTGCKMPDMALGCIQISDAQLTSRQIDMVETWAGGQHGLTEIATLLRRLERPGISQKPATSTTLLALEDKPGDYGYPSANSGRITPSLSGSDWSYTVPNNHGPLLHLDDLDVATGGETLEYFGDATSLQHKRAICSTAN